MKAHPELRAALDELLEKLDQTIDPSFQDRIHLYIAGGIALNYYCGSRYTEDLDASFSHRLQFDSSQMRVNYTRADGSEGILYLDPNYNPNFSLLHEDFEQDAIPWADLNKPGRRLYTQILSPLDLAVSKMSRLNHQDEEDIMYLASDGLLTPASLRERAEQALGNYIGDARRIRMELDRLCLRIQSLRATPPNSRPPCEGQL